MNESNMVEKLVSIIIPTCNRKELLFTLLNSIQKQTYKRYEVIVIEDASTDTTYETVKEKFPRVKIYSFTKNCGPSYAKNYGFINSKGDFILFLDSDVELIEDNIIERMVELLSEDKTIGQLGGEAVYKKRLKIAVMGRKLISPLRMNTKFVKTTKYTKMKTCDYLPTSSCIMRAEVFRKSGGFDPLYVYPGEDVDLGIRIKQMGYKNIVHFDVGVLHKFSQQSRLNRAYTYYRAQMKFTLQHCGIVRALINPIQDISEEYTPRIKGFILRRIGKNLAGNSDDGLDMPGEKSFTEAAIYMATLPFQLCRAYLWNILKITNTFRKENNYFDETMKHISKIEVRQ